VTKSIYLYYRRNGKVIMFIPTFNFVPMYIYYFCSDSFKLCGNLSIAVFSEKNIYLWLISKANLEYFKLQTKQQILFVNVQKLLGFESRSEWRRIHNVNNNEW